MNCSIAIPYTYPIMKRKDEAKFNGDYPERFAQQAMGHNSKAVHHAYSKHAEVTVPALEDWEKQWGKDEGRRMKDETGQKSECRSQKPMGWSRSRGCRRWWRWISGRRGRR